MSKYKLFRCCKHGTCPTDCPICQRILLIWTLKQIRPDLLKEMIRYIASSLPRERSLIVCSMCNITRYTIESHKSFCPKDLDGTLVVDGYDQTVRISCGYCSRYDNDEICFADGLERMTYTVFKRRYGVTSHSVRGTDRHLTFTEVTVCAGNVDDDGSSKDTILDSDKEDDGDSSDEIYFEKMIPIMNIKEIAVYRPEREYLLNICDNCIDHMIETGMVDHKEPEYVDIEDSDEGGFKSFGDVDYDHPEK